MTGFDTPILLAAFNRPNHVAKGLSMLQEIRPRRLYVSCDGPRPSRPDDEMLVNQVRRVVAEQVTWPCQLQTLFHEENLGCRNAISSAIRWFFSQEPEGIVLEDDIEPHPSFFEYCRELLARYRNEKRVFLISGTNMGGVRPEFSESYGFSRYPLIWGWASWADRWAAYDAEIADWPVLAKSDLLAKTLGNRWYEFTWKRFFSRTYRGEINSWDFQAVLLAWKQGQVSIVPRYNMVKNTGMDGEQTHRQNNGSVASLQPLPMPFPLSHPGDVVSNDAYDRRLETENFSSTFFHRLKVSVLSRLGV